MIYSAVHQVRITLLVLMTIITYLIIVLLLINLNKNVKKTTYGRNYKVVSDLSEVNDHDFDPSGNMSLEDIISSSGLQVILSEVFNIIKKRNTKVTVIECDTKVNNVYIVKNPSDIKYQVRGRGGTSFSPVIEYINSNKYYRDSILIYFTDGYGNKAIPKPLVYRNIWCLLDSDYLSVDKPYGAILNISTKYIN